VARRCRRRAPVLRPGCSAWTRRPGCGGDCRPGAARAEVSDAVDPDRRAGLLGGREERRRGRSVPAQGRAGGGRRQGLPGVDLAGLVRRLDVHDLRRRQIGERRRHEPRRRARVFLGSAPRLTAPRAARGGARVVAAGVRLHRRADDRERGVPALHGRDLRDRAGARAADAIDAGVCACRRPTRGGRADPGGRPRRRDRPRDGAQAAVRLPGRRRRAACRCAAVRSDARRPGRGRDWVCRSQARTGRRSLVGARRVLGGRRCGLLLGGRAAVDAPPSRRALAGCRSRADGGAGCSRRARSRASRCRRSSW
jgi:hypothetical protein